MSLVTSFSHNFCHRKFLPDLIAKAWADITSKDGIKSTKTNLISADAGSTFFVFVSFALVLPLLSRMALLEP